MKRYEKIVLIVSLIAALMCLSLALLAESARWLTTASILFGLSGLIQLEISGLFDRILEIYGDDEKYPFGPPSHITREIIDSPDTPVRTWVRNALFFERNTGLYLLVTGLIIQLLVTWM